MRRQCDRCGTRRRPQSPADVSLAVAAREAVSLRALQGTLFHRAEQSVPAAAQPLIVAEGVDGTAVAVCRPHCPLRRSHMRFPAAPRLCCASLLVALAACDGQMGPGTERSATDQGAQRHRPKGSPAPSAVCGDGLCQSTESCFIRPSCECHVSGQPGARGERGAGPRRDARQQRAARGRATDDGLPAGSTVAVTWSKQSGPGTVTFAAPSAVATTASFCGGHVRAAADRY